jgi:hypothetical protein
MASCCAERAVHDKIARLEFHCRVAHELHTDTKLIDEALEIGRWLLASLIQRHQEVGPTEYWEQITPHGQCVGSYAGHHGLTFLT